MKKKKSLLGAEDRSPSFIPRNAPSALSYTLRAQRETETWESGLGLPSSKLEEQWVETQPETAPSWHLTAWSLRPLQLSFFPLLHWLFQ